MRQVEFLIFDVVVIHGFSTTDESPEALTRVWLRARVFLLTDRRALEGDSFLFSRSQAFLRRFSTCFLVKFGVSFFHIYSVQ